jgi:hypothetical protein
VPTLFGLPKTVLEMPTRWHNGFRAEAKMSREIKIKGKWNQSKLKSE